MLSSLRFRFYKFEVFHLSKFNIKFSLISLFITFLKIENNIYLHFNFFMFNTKSYIFFNNNLDLLNLVIVYTKGTVHKN